MQRGVMLSTMKLCEMQELAFQNEEVFDTGEFLLM